MKPENSIHSLPANSNCLEAAIDENHSIEYWGKATDKGTAKILIMVGEKNLREGSEIAELYELADRKAYAGHWFSWESLCQELKIKKVLES